MRTEATTTITFELPASTAWLLQLSAYRIRTAGQTEMSPSDIAKAIVQEVLIDDAATHGLTSGCAELH